jgi:MATE family multidrug resistance protein
MGVLMALDPVVAQAVGAGDQVGVARGVQRGLVMSVGLTVLSVLLLLPARPVLAALRQPAEVLPDAVGYVDATIAGVFPLFAFTVLRQSLQAMSRVRPIVLTVLAANVANAALNWVFIYGHLGSPALGAVGAGIATSISRWLLAFGLLAAAWRELRPLLLPWRRDALAAAPLARMFALGLPIGAQFVLEASAFNVIGLMMGWLGTAAMGGHQVAINLASLTFMVPLGVSSAAAVLVGQAVGRGDAPAARRLAAAALVCGVGFMSLTAVAFLVAHGLLARVYSSDVEVLAVAAALIPIAGVFQVFDGTQVVAIGVLRGAGDTRTPMAVAMLGYWLLGMPASLYLGFRAGAGAAGLWWGLVVGLAVVAVILLVRVRRRLGGELRRVVIDRPIDDAA